jgi:hypothetical protein
MPDLEFPRCGIQLGRTRARKFVRVVVDLVYAALGSLCETEIVFQARIFVPFLYRRFGKMVFLGLLALSGFNNLRRINQVISSTPVASTNISFIINHLKTYFIFLPWRSAGVGFSAALLSRSSFSTSTNN